MTQQPTSKTPEASSKTQEAIDTLRVEILEHQNEAIILIDNGMFYSARGEINKCIERGNRLQTLRASKRGMDIVRGIIS